MTSLPVSPPLQLGPTPPWNNPIPQPQFYNPSQFFISGITLGWNTTVTTTKNMNYVIGQLIRLLIPNGFGCIQLNQQTGYVISIPASNQVVVTINSSQNVDQFISATLNTQPQIVAVGDINQGVTNTGRTNNQTYIHGSFINVSPL